MCAAAAILQRRKGDTNALWAGDVQLRSKAPRIAARFVDDRNVKWVPRIEAELKTGKPTAIVAGALHFSGPRSVIALLQKRGYVIEQLQLYSAAGTAPE